MSISLAADTVIIERHDEVDRVTMEDDPRSTVSSRVDSVRVRIDETRIVRRPPASESRDHVASYLGPSSVYET